MHTDETTWKFSDARAVTGHLGAALANGRVVAMSQNGRTTIADVRYDGRFRLDLKRGQGYLLMFFDSTDGARVMRFRSHEGSPEMTSILYVGGTPGWMSMMDEMRNCGMSDGMMGHMSGDGMCGHMYEDHDGKIEFDPVDLGTVREVDHEHCEPDNNPHMMVDTDGDGTPDFVDNDDDGDGVDDEDDEDADGNGMSDHHMAFDTDGDKTPDIIDGDDDDDGVADGDETDFADGDGDGIDDDMDHVNNACHMGSRSEACDDR
jgi:hypothetical protein